MSVLTTDTESPPGKENPASGETSGINEQNLLTETTTNTESAESQWEPKTVEVALKSYHKLVNGGAIPEKAEELLSKNLSDGDRVKFHKDILKNPPGVPHVSECRHPDGSRNWKAINARRKNPYCLSRYKAAQIKKFKKLSFEFLSDEKHDEIMDAYINRGLSCSAVVNAAIAEILPRSSEAARQSFLNTKAARRMKSCWQGVMKATREVCQTSDTDEIAATALQYLLRTGAINVRTFDIVNGTDEGPEPRTEVCENCGGTLKECHCYDLEGGSK
jgi:hypothetical protein